MSDMDMTKEERDDLIEKVTDLTERGVMKRPDAVEILSVCQRACKRRIEEIDEIVRPESRIQ